MSASILTSHGLHNADALVEAAQTVGVPLWIAAAFAEKESNGRNVYGSDKGGTFAGGGDVTEANFAEFYRLVVDEGQKSNGVGPMQITYRSYFPQAKAEGLRLWVPLDNFLFGLRIVARHLAGDYSVEGLQRAGTLYNKGNLLTGINPYGFDLAAKAALWRARLNAAPDEGATMTHYTRAQWGARPYRTGGNAVTNGPKGVDFHYNGPKMGIPVDVPCGCSARVRSIQNFHMDVKGWKDIAYDVVACPHGNTFQGRLGTPNGTGANGTDSANRNYMAVMGLFGDGDPFGDDLKRAMLAGRGLCRKAGAGAEIHPHSDHESTSCPGNACRAWIAAGAPAPAGTPTPPQEVPTMLTSLLVSGARTGETRSRGPEVELLQKMLNGMDKAGLTVDGSFGPNTETAVKKAQSKRGLTADGRVGPLTRDRLNKDWTAHNAPKPPPAPTPPPAPAVTLADVLAAVQRVEAKVDALTPKEATP